MSNDKADPKAPPAVNPEDQRLVPVTLPVAQWKLIVAALGNAGTFNQIAPLVTTLHQQIMESIGTRQQRRAAAASKRRTK